MERFWSKVRKSHDGCWVWTGAVNNKGYGVFFVKKGVTSTAHKYSYIAAHPYTKVKKGMSLCIMHKCDNRRCVRPSHLMAGTPKRNTQDMLRKGRQSKPGGRAHGNSKLTWPVVRNIRRNYNGKYGELKALCVRYDVRKSTLKDILSGRSWKESGEN